MAIQINFRRAAVDSGLLGNLAEQWRQRRCLRFCRFLEPSLANRALELSRQLPFHPVTSPVGSREMCDAAPLRGFLMLLLNRQPLFDSLEALCGRGPIGCFEGTVYRLQPHSAQRLDWHDDHPGQRKLALSLGLSQQPYQGGELQLRRKGHTELLAREPQLLLGDAILFDVDVALEHRVTPVEGNHPRAVFAGWFLPGPLQTVGPARTGPPK
jgi:hypothetical protein